MRPVLYDAAGQPTHWAYEADQYRVEKPTPPRMVDPVTFHPHPLDPRYGPQPFPIHTPDVHVEVSTPPAIVLLSRTSTDEERVQTRRARGMERLGWLNPRKAGFNVEDSLRMMIQGICRRPVA